MFLSQRAVSRFPSQLSGPVRVWLGLLLQIKGWEFGSGMGFPRAQTVCRHGYHSIGRGSVTTIQIPNFLSANGCSGKTKAKKDPLGRSGWRAKTSLWVG